MGNKLKRTLKNTEKEDTRSSHYPWVKIDPQEELFSLPLPTRTRIQTSFEAVAAAHWMAKKSLRCCVGRTCWKSAIWGAGGNYSQGATACTSKLTSKPPKGVPREAASHCALLAAMCYRTAGDSHLGSRTCSRRRHSALRTLPKLKEPEERRTPETKGETPASYCVSPAPSTDKDEHYSRWKRNLQDYALVPNR